MRIWVIVAAALAFGAPATVEADPRFEPQACADAALKAGARCGVVRVFEDRSTAQGRTIDLSIVILPATGPGPHLPPLFTVSGGPGEATNRNVSFYAEAGMAYRVRRDVVMLDQRGTGRSNALICPEIAAEPETAEMFSRAYVEGCRRHLEPRADLRMYGTDAAVADMEVVRSALGYQRIDLVAGSYGTTLAMRYISAHPDRVRAAILSGAAPTFAMPPQHHATAAYRAIRLIWADCAADAACHAAFADPARDLDLAVAHLAKSGELKPERFTEALRSIMYSAAGSRSLLYLVHRAGAGDMAPFMEATGGAALGSTFADGLYLSITCTESLGLMDYAAAAKAARATPFGDYRLRRQLEACKNWPVAQLPADHLTPVKAPAAILFVSGYLDPVTPPEWAAEAAKGFPNARQLVLRYSGHNVRGLSNLDTCYDGLMIRFLDNADAAGLDARCVADLRPPPFITSAPAK
ncbi:MAG: alpha/beta hydrolase [Pseudomonadota bacterium]